MTISEIERTLADHGVIADVVANKDNTVDIITESFVPYSIRDDIDAIRPIGILFNWVVRSRSPSMSLPSSLSKWYNNIRKYIK